MPERRREISITPGNPLRTVDTAPCVFAREPTNVNARKWSHDMKRTLFAQAQVQVYRDKRWELHHIRQRAIDQIWRQHPDRFIRRPPRALSLPD